MGWRITDSEILENAVLELRFRLAEKIGVRHGMTVVEMGCGQGGFTACLARIVGDYGKIVSVDVSEEYLTEFNKNLTKQGVNRLVTFVKADAANLKRVLVNDFADMVVSYRFLEELKHPEDMFGIVKEMTRIAEKNGKVCIVEMSTKAESEAEENYIRLHKESGDSLFEPHEIVKAMEKANLAKIGVETFATDIWFSPKLAKQDLSLTQVWFTQDEEKRLGSRIDKYGMKYPAFLMFSGFKPQT
jgi:cyclopropane fatty-acyl-phospholipid synthase-like methyltransferase